MLKSVFLIISASLLWFLAIGMICFNAGMVRSKNAVTVFVKSLVAIAFSIIIVSYPSHNTILHYMLVIFANGKEVVVATEQNVLPLLLMKFSHMLFPALALFIVIAASAERLKLWAFILFTIFYTALVHPMVEHWIWNGGYLANMGFIDAAGSDVIFLSGATAGLIICALLGPRRKRYNDDNEKRIVRSSNLPLAALGALLIWVGFIGLTCVSYLSQPQAISLLAITRGIINVSCAGASGLLVALFLARIFYGFSDISFMLNGLLGGLTAIVASPLTATSSYALLIGAIAGLLVILFIPLFDKLRLDDPMGVLASFGIGSIWGLLSVVLTQPYEQAFSQLTIQLLGIVVILSWVSATSLILWLCLKYLIGIRVNKEGEERGLDFTDCGIQAYPEFTTRGK